MYPQCRHLRPAGSICRSPAIKGSYWCYYHAKFHERRKAHDLPHGGIGKPEETIDCGTIISRDVVEGNQREASATVLSFPVIEDEASIQFALIDVLQALAANRLDPKRAGLLLYGLQVASANVKKDLSQGDVRTVTHTEDGTPLAPQTYGYDIEDYLEVAKEVDGD